MLHIEFDNLASNNTNKALVCILFKNNNDNNPILQIN